ncbi:Hypothetical protein HVR_LOCUS507 [uncultured virus]|nr:Hypothetical protein HVR_LOCUS507 [uncultured virus]
MNGGSQGAAGSIPTATVLDYLNPDINRPDLYEERSFIVKDIRGPSSSTPNRNKAVPVVVSGTGADYSSTNTCGSFTKRSTASSGGQVEDSFTKGRKFGAVLYTVGVIVLSAAIFITLVSWADVLRSWFDTKYINPIIGQQLKARIYFATTITIIAIIVIALLFWLWWRGTMKP